MIAKKVKDYAKEEGIKMGATSMIVKRTRTMESTYSICLRKNGTHLRTMTYFANKKLLCIPQTTGEIKRVSF